MPKIYKINPVDMTIVHAYDRVSDITTDKHVYRTLNGQQYKYKDGFIYRYKKDVEIDTDNNIVINDKFTPLTNTDKLYKKYTYPITLLRTTTYSIKEICNLTKHCEGYTLSEPTCRKLKKLFCENQ